nr:hypothetical protein [uncultured Acetatifactor sp.]
MFYSKYKKQVLEDYGKVIAEYNDFYGKTQREVQRLYERRRISIELIRKIEDLVNSIANRPKEYNIITQKIDFEREKFHEKEEYAEQAYHEAKKAGINIAAGVASGTAVAAAAPTAALWVATTFGTASTGTAISTLSGAAATNAALAWLGGGALSAGGAGVAGGQALLMLAGPVGWTIAGGAVVVSTAVLGIKNKKIADKAAEEGREIMRMVGQLRETGEKVEALSKETVTLYGRLNKLHGSLREYREMDYLELKEEVQYQLGGLVNDTLSLSEMLNKAV